MKKLQSFNPSAKEGSILIMTAVEAEREAVLRGLSGNPRFVVELAGVGAASAAALTAGQLAAGGYRAVISAGIGGGFARIAPMESVVVATSIIAADLGAETAEGFSSVDELGFGSSRLPVDADTAAHWTQLLAAGGLQACAGPVLTVSTVTGTAATAAALTERVPGAAAEAMEGYGVGIAARAVGVPVFEIRAISNLVGPRNRAAWRIKEALQSLETAFHILTEVL
ncbi:futalosine hydrolase [Paenibacillus sp. P96]|uniref:Futalosine hydrolase n=1 Tax=Paenibacillus zeirhizosphaerae TaxID=2987519 RepID=A0ABT9FUT9_9BACL|nr:futalosine hydrolase [Paenibacillus sp. P96]MDP4098439.1 futalosine hydrolase [Paenibacillus sp. P96]